MGSCFHFSYRPISTMSKAGVFWRIFSFQSAVYNWDFKGYGSNFAKRLIQSMSCLIAKIATFVSQNISAIILQSLCYRRRISQLTCTPKTVGRMTDFDFETLALCIFLFSSQKLTHFRKDLVTGYCLFLVKKFIPTVIRFRMILSPTPCCYGLDVTTNSCIFRQRQGSSISSPCRVSAKLLREISMIFP